MIRTPRRFRYAAAPAVGALLLVSCGSSPGLPEPEELEEWEDSERVEFAHRGPEVALQESGPQRFVAPAYEAFDVERAMETVAFLDRRIRTPGSRDFDQVLDHLHERLAAAGYGSSERFELSWLESEMDAPSWHPERARIALELGAEGARELHSFEQRHEVDRVMLPRNAPSCDVSGPVAFGLDDLDEGDVFLTRTALRADLIQRAKRKGAVAVVSAALAGYNQDPGDRARDLDAIQYREVPTGTDLPVMQISPRSYAVVQEEHLSRGEAVLSLSAEVRTGGREVRTLVATVVGRDRADEAVVFVSHVQEPGASDNASGAAGQLEAALFLADAVRMGDVGRPSRTVVFVWGSEFEESRAWLEATARTPVAGVNAVMVGNSRERTGARPLLERYPDPGAVVTVPPDRHTLWGSGEVDPDWLVPNGLSIVARCALVDVSRHVGGDWETFENPWEGGTDHDNLIRAGVPVVLFWHFPDFTFHTSLDRYEMVDGEELRRMSVAALATGLALADPRPTDLDRYLKSMDDARRFRLEAAAAVDRDDVAEAWTQWFDGVQHWFRGHCLGIELPAATPIEASERLADAPPVPVEDEDDESGEGEGEDG